MDELVGHCLRELSFDGDLGCDITRLQDFVKDFYSRSGAAQVVDDDYCAFVWSVVAQQPSVIIGTVPEGSHGEISIAPQPSQLRKARESGIVNEAPSATQLDVIADAATHSLGELKETYGNRLRIATDAETTFVAITGSHIRPSKLTPMVYTALQLITRARETGVSTVAIGKTTGYDQKTCHYLISQLLHLNLVLKLRRGGVGSHFCVHKYFYENSELWKAVREEERRLQARPGDNEEAESGDGPVDAADFTGPIDAKHLASLSILRFRIASLLEGCRNKMHPCFNLILAIGFTNPTKTDRRFFKSRLKELAAEGLIEFVEIPHNKGWAKCIRLATAEAPLDGRLLILPEVDTTEVAQGGPEQDSGVRANMTLHRQIISLLEEAGGRGMTLNELCSTLGDFDRRTIELILTRLERAAPPAHLADLGIIEVMEHSGRERHHRYFTAAAYRAVYPQDARYVNLDLSQAGGFAVVEEGQFYTDDAEMHKVVDQMRLVDESESASVAAPSLRKKKVPKNPILPDGTVKKGRPRKYPEGAREHYKKGGKKRKSTKKAAGELGEDAEDLDAPAAKKQKRIQLPEQEEVDEHAISDTILAEDDKNTSTSVADAQLPHTPSSKRGRGRGRGRGRARGGRRGRSSARLAQPVPSEQEELDNIAPPASLETELDEVVDANAPPTGDIDDSEPLIPDFPADSTVSAPLTPLTLLSQSNSPMPIIIDDAQEAELQPVHSPSGAHNAFQSSSSAQTALSVSVVAPMNVVHKDSGSQAPEVGVSAPMVTTIQHEAVDDPSTPTVLGKRQEPATSSSPPHQLQKRAKTSAVKKGKSNISHLLRESEVLRLLDNNGGIMVTNVKEFIDAHQALLETLRSVQEQTSTPPGVRADKRTMESTLNKLESQGKIKLVKTTFRNLTGTQKSAAVAFLPSVEQGQVNEYLANVASRPFQYQVDAPTIRRIETPVGYGREDTTQGPLRPRASLSRPKLVESTTSTLVKQALPETAESEPRLDPEEETTRSALLDDQHTLAQTHGYIVPKMTRIRRFHLLTVTAVEDADPSPFVISKEERIVHMSYYFQDIAVADYCAILSVLVQSQELRRVLNDPQRRTMPIRDLPAEVYSSMRVGKVRTRTRVLEMLNVLRALNLVTPLRPSTSATPDYVCAPNGDHPTQFERHPSEGWTPSAASLAPSYWKFNSVAPIHLWVISSTPRVFWKDMPVETSADCGAFWAELGRCAFDLEYANGVRPTTEGHSTTGPLPLSVDGTASVTRQSSWRSQYIFSIHQEHYLKKHVNQATGVPLFEGQDDAEQRLARISLVVSAPQSAVVEFYTKLRAKRGSELDKARRRKQKAKDPEETLAAPGEDIAQKATQKAILAKRAAEGKDKRRQDWDELVARLCPDPSKPAIAVRLARLRSQYLTSSKAALAKVNWEEEVQTQVKEAEVLSRPAPPSLSMSAARQSAAASNSSLVILQAPERSVQDLINSQGPALEPRLVPKKRRNKKKPEEEDVEEDTDTDEQETVDGIKTRRRFPWEREYDDLALDAAAVIRVRCRGINKPLNWTALETVFPAVPKNSVRQRIARLVEGPGGERYQQRLETKWAELWQQHIGTEELPDSNLKSAVVFPVVQHIEFLRRHIDKNALRVGPALPGERASAQIPRDLDAVYRAFDVIEKEQDAPTWDFVWTGLLDESREHNILTHPFLVDVQGSPPVENPSSDMGSIAEAAIKMVLSTSNAEYDSEAASAFLKGVGEESVSAALTTLLEKGTVSKIFKDPSKPRPGRSLKFSDANQKALEGTITEGIFQNASLWEDDLETPPVADWREWDLAASSGDMAAMLELVSEDKVDFDIDTSIPQTARFEIDWNSKKADDDQIETSLHLRMAQMSVSESPSMSLHDKPEKVFMMDQSVESNSVPASGHGTTASGEIASCQVSSTGTIDCEACINESLTAWLAAVSDDMKLCTDLLLSAIREAGPNGLAKFQVLSVTKMDADPHLLVQSLTALAPPPLFWAGYATPVLMAAEHLRSWTVMISENPLTRVLPRRWFGINGERIDDVWQAGLRAILGLVVFRPGISRAEVKWRLRAVYDIQEVDELVQHLIVEGSLSVRSQQDDWLDEKQTFLFIAEGRRWYQV